MLFRTFLWPHLRRLLSREGRKTLEARLEAYRTLHRSSLFDAEYYLARNPDVKQAGINPVWHYLDVGAREERDPSEAFRTGFYLRANPDVQESGMNPLLHYIYFGRDEGRPPLPVPPKAADNQSLDPQYTQLKECGLLDPDFYVNQYRCDLAALDPVAHFLDVGVKEGRNPCRGFDTRFYLSDNQDVGEGGMNPLVHYATYGRSEGRPVTPTEAVRQLVDGCRKLASHTVSALSESYEHVHTVVIEALCRPDFTLAFSHDDYLNSVGGVQLCMQDEQRELSGRELSYIQIYPTVPHLNLRPAADGLLLSLNVDGKPIEGVPCALVERLLRDLVDAHGFNCRQALVHQLLGWSLDAASALIRASRTDNPVFWVHDFFSVCPQPHLLRNMKEYCHAPGLESNACEICRFGTFRRENLPAFRRFLACHSFTVMAPSEFALEMWRRHFPDVSPCEVAPPLVLEAPDETSVPSQDVAPTGGRRRVAFLGHPNYHKGWFVWRRLLKDPEVWDRYEFFHLGQRPDVFPEMFTEVRVDWTNRAAMLDALKSHRIEVTFLWSLVPETFSLTLYESLAAGCYVLTHEDSGNIANYVQRHGVGSVFGREEDLREFLLDPDGLEAGLRKHQENPSVTGELKVRNWVSRLYPAPEHRH